MDPVTIALLAQAAVGLGKAGYGAYQQRRGKQQLANAFEAPTGTPAEFAEMLKQARAGQLTQRRLDEINRTMGTSTKALQEAGGRAVLGGIGAVTQAGAKQKTAVLNQQQQEIMRALQTNANFANVQRGRDIARQNREEGFAQNAIQAGATNITAGLSDVIGAGVQYQSAKSEGLLKPKKTKTTATTPATEEIADIEQPMDPLMGQKPRWDAAMVDEEEYYNKGGAFKTPGAYSHSKNPIDLVQNGKKIGEATGGEYIFNPKQAKNLKKLSGKGNTDLHKFVRSLLNKPQFK